MGCPILLGDIAATTPCYTDPRGKRKGVGGVKTGKWVQPQCLSCLQRPEEAPGRSQDYVRYASGRDRCINTLSTSRRECVLGEQSWSQQSHF